MILRDRRYLDWLKTQRCVFTGLMGSEYDAIDPMHIGTAGKGIKSPDNEVLPALHSIHREAHQKGEVSIIRQYAPDDVIRAAFRAYARELYEQYKADNPEAEPRKRAKKAKAKGAKKSLTNPKFKRTVGGKVVARKVAA